MIASPSDVLRHLGFTGLATPAALRATSYWREIQASVDLDPGVRDFARDAESAISALAGRIAPASHPDSRVP